MGTRRVQCHGKPYELTLFFRKPSPFSNHHPAEFTSSASHNSPDEYRFFCSEQFYMFNKATYFQDFETARKIINARSAREMKRMGGNGSILGFKKLKWDEVKENVMMVGLMEKFRQNIHLRFNLFVTCGSRLVECSPMDNYWGIGRSIHEPEAANERKWRGKNRLGELLGKVRDSLMQEPDFQDEVNFIQQCFTADPAYGTKVCTKYDMIYKERAVTRYYMRSGEQPWEYESTIDEEALSLIPQWALPPPLEMENAHILASPLILEDSGDGVPANTRQSLPADLSKVGTPPPARPTPPPLKNSGTDPRVPVNKRLSKLAGSMKDLKRRRAEAKKAEERSTDNSSSSGTSSSESDSESENDVDKKSAKYYHKKDNKKAHKPRDRKRRRGHTRSRSRTPVKKHSRRSRSESSSEDDREKRDDWKRKKSYTDRSSDYKKRRNDRDRSATPEDRKSERSSDNKRKREDRSVTPDNRKDDDRSPELKRKRSDRSATPEKEKYGYMYKNGKPDVSRGNGSEATEEELREKLEAERRKKMEDAANIEKEKEIAARLKEKMEARRSMDEERKKSRSRERSVSSGTYSESDSESEYERRRRREKRSRKDRKKRRSRSRSVEKRRDRDDHRRRRRSSSRRNRRSRSRSTDFRRRPRMTTPPPLPKKLVKMPITREKTAVAPIVKTERLSPSDDERSRKNKFLNSVFKQRR